MDKTKINSTEEFGHEPKSMLFSNDGVYHAKINHSETKLELFHENNSTPINIIDFNPLTEGDFHSIRVNGRRLEFITKTDGNKVAHSFGNNCIASFDESGHYHSIDDGYFSIKNKEGIPVWSKLPVEVEEDCAFPQSGPNSLGSNQNWAEYNQPLTPKKMK